MRRMWNVTSLSLTPGPRLARCAARDFVSAARGRGDNGGSYGAAREFRYTSNWVYPPALSVLATFGSVRDGRGLFSIHPGFHRLRCLTEVRLIWNWPVRRRGWELWELCFTDWEPRSPAGARDDLKFEI